MMAMAAAAFQLARRAFVGATGWVVRSERLALKERRAVKRPLVRFARWMGGTKTVGARVFCSAPLKTGALGQVRSRAMRHLGLGLKSLCSASISRAGRLRFFLLRRNCLPVCTLECARANNRVAQT